MILNQSLEMLSMFLEQELNETEKLLKNINEFANRRCTNCMFMKDLSGAKDLSRIYCTNEEVIKGQAFYLLVDKNFYCNKHEGVK